MRPPPLLLPYEELRRLSKQLEQYTGLSPRGSKGTWVSLPHSAQVAEYIWRSPRPKPPPLEYPPPWLLLRAALQLGHLEGSLVKPF